MGLSNSRSCDVDSLQAKRDKYVINSITPTLVYIFHITLLTSTFSEDKKSASVSVVFFSKEATET